jgi:hypothetical protein
MTAAKPSSIIEERKVRQDVQQKVSQKLEKGFDGKMAK